MPDILPGLLIGFALGVAFVLLALFLLVCAGAASAEAERDDFGAEEGGRTR